MEEKRRDGGTLTPSFAGGSSDSPSSEPTSTRRRAGSLKRKANAVSASNFSSAPSKRMMTREKAMLISQPLFHNGPLTRARQAPSNLDAATALAAAGAKQEMENASVDGKDGAGNKEEEETNKAIEEWEALEAKIEAEFEAIRSRESNVHVVPNHCGWFSWIKIHPVEERLLPSFFNGKCDGRTPDVYLEIRNWIVKKFHTDPSIQFELKDLLELEVGDSDAKQEVMEFLDYWGLINFHPFPPADSTSATADGDDVEEKDSLVEKLYTFPESQSLPALAPKPHLTAQAISPGLVPESMVADDSLKPEGPAVEYHCNSCSADCSRKRYHCPKQADYDLCTECFNSGKFDSGMSSSDFILMGPAEAPGVGSGKWTDQETLLLLEGLELFKENWSEIAEHVATKTKAQCMLHFLQMPIEDMFLDYDDDKYANSKEAADLAATNDDKSNSKDPAESTEDKNGATDDQPLTSAKDTSESEDASEGKVPQETSRTEDETGEVKVDRETAQPSNSNDGKVEDETVENIALKALREAFEGVGYPLSHEKPLSFADVGNPVMALAAFLGKLAGSDVATASAHASLKSIESSSSGLWLAMRHCFILEDPPDDKKESVASESAVEKLSHNNEHKDEKHEGHEAEIKGLDNRELSNANSSEELGDSDPEEKKQSSLDGESTAMEDASREPRTSKEVKTSDSKEAKDPKLPKELGGKNSERERSKDKEAAKSENSFQPAKVCGDVEMTDSLPSEENESQQTVKTAGEEISLAKEAPKDVPLVPDASGAAASVPENGAETDEHQNDDGKKLKYDFEGTKDEQSIEKLKRAAVAAISGAAVKAKLLARQEEDQIRQLSVSLIEKQLHKLETKLMFFSEMESVTMRVREQLERSRQRLYHERAQIIAARLGMPTSSSTSSSKTLLPTNRIATNFANAVPRPPMGMAAYPRPPMPRPLGMVGTVPNASNPLASTAMMGGSGQPSGTDKVSSA